MLTAIRPLSLAGVRFELHCRAVDSHRRSAVACIVALFALSACSDDGLPAADDTRMRVGRADSGDMAFAAAVEDDTISVYACGGEQTFATNTRWFRDGTLADDAFSMELDGWTIAGDVAARTIDGTLTDPAGNQIAWSVEAVGDDELAGLYTKEIDGCVTGLVVQRDGETLDTQGTWCNDRAEFAQVIVLPPVVVKDEGIKVKVERPTDGPTEFFVEPF